MTIEELHRILASTSEWLNTEPGQALLRYLRGTLHQTTYTQLPGPDGQPWMYSTRRMLTRPDPHEALVAIGRDEVVTLLEDMAAHGVGLLEPRRLHGNGSAV